MAAIGLIRLTDEATFTLGGVKVAPAARTLAAGESVLVVEPRVMQVLVTLARHRGEVVGRERLVDACWDGRIVGEDSINRAILKLRRALSKVGGGVAIETVAKVGHRLRVSETASPADPTPPRVRHLRGWLLAGTVAVAASAIAALALKPDQAPETRRIVAVQPLQAATGDAPARQLSQDFASDLSRAVLGHDGKLSLADARSGAPRSAAFTVMGSVESVGNDLHTVVSIQGTDDPAILWSHDYTGPLADAAGLRERIGTDVAGVLICAIGTDGMPDRVDDETIALYLESCDLQAGNFRKGSDLLRQVTVRAPRFAGAWAGLSTSLAFAGDQAVGADADAMRHEGHAAALRALSLDPHQCLAYFTLTILMPGIRNWAIRERIVDTGLTAQPDCPQLYNMRAEDLSAIGRLQDSIATSRRAIAIDPFHPGKVDSLARALAARVSWTRPTTSSVTCGRPGRTPTIPGKADFERRRCSATRARPRRCWATCAAGSSARAGPPPGGRSCRSAKRRRPTMSAAPSPS